MKIETIAFLTAFSLFFATAYSQKNDSTIISTRYKVFGTNLYGVWDVNSQQLIVDTIYNQIGIQDIGLIICQYTSYITNGVTRKLPGPVFETYDTNGNMIIRNVDFLLQADTIPYTISLEFAKHKGIREIEPMVDLIMGMRLEKSGMRREAYQHYMHAYNQYPELIIAKEMVDNIRNNMNNERAKIQQEIDEDEERRKALDAQNTGTNPYLAFADAMHSLANTLNTIDQTQKSKTKNNTKTTTVPKSKTINRGKSTTHNTDNKNDPKHIQERICDYCGGTGRCYYMYDMYTNTKHCRGRGVCTYCGGEGIIMSPLTSKYETCPLCNGKKKCVFCNGSGQCTRCNGTGKLKR